jgi:hypothetical protein
MISLTEKYARKVGCVDALIFFVVWVGIGMAIATRPVETLPLVTMFGPCRCSGWMARRSLCTRNS